MGEANHNEMKVARRFIKFYYGSVDLDETIKDKYAWQLPHVGSTRVGYRN